MTATLSKLNRRAFITATSAIVAGALIRPHLALAQHPTSPGWLSQVNPQLRDIALRLSAQTEAIQNAPEGPISAFRASLSREFKPSNDTPDERLSIPVPNQPNVTIHVINAISGAARGGILHMHGGGFITGSAESRVPDLQRLAAKIGGAIVTVSYRLAPETTYYGSTEDNYAAEMALTERGAGGC